MQCVVKTSSWQSRLLANQIILMLFAHQDAIRSTQNGLFHELREDKVKKLGVDSGYGVTV